MTLRLDKYLKVSRIIKRRTLANEACDAGKVTVNGKVARASLEIKENDVIEIQFGAQTAKYKVLRVVEHVTKDAAAEMFQVL